MRTKFTVDGSHVEITYPNGRTRTYGSFGGYVYDVTDKPGTTGRQILDPRSPYHGTTLSSRRTGAELADLLRQCLRVARQVDGQLEHGDSIDYDVTVGHDEDGAPYNKRVSLGAYSHFDTAIREVNRLNLAGRVALVTRRADGAVWHLGRWTGVDGSECDMDSQAIARSGDMPTDIELAMFGLSRLSEDFECNYCGERIPIAVVCVTERGNVPVVVCGSCGKTLAGIVAKHAIASAIEATSERLCIEHLGYTPSTWFTGGSAHNDDRLRATVRGDSVTVTDGNAHEDYDGDLDGVGAFVRDWLDAVWGCVSMHADTRAVASILRP